MTNYSKKFFDSFDYFMNNYREYIPMDTSANPQEMIEIVEGLKRGEKTAFNRRIELADSLEDIMDNLYDNHEGMHHRMPNEYIKGEKVYNKELEMINIIENSLLPYFEIPTMELFGIMTSDEKMGLTSMARQKGLPVEMKDEISKYVGINPKGGIRRPRTQRKRKSRHNKKGHNKSKSIRGRKRHNKSKSRKIIKIYKP